ncbi:hypothetical protein [Coralliovum pocilloporae]|uniref:hypothetical protein n=1 Tax=Coralliovum pocilloporae TaxID=3066369 RepID=UPI0033072CA8
MTQDQGSSKPSAKAERDKRLAEALRTNLRRRKAQKRERPDDEADGPQFRHKPVPKAE